MALMFDDVKLPALNKFFRKFRRGVNSQKGGWRRQIDRWDGIKN